MTADGYELTAQQMAAGQAAMAGKVQDVGRAGRA